MDNRGSNPSFANQQLNTYNSVRFKRVRANTFEVDEWEARKLRVTGTEQGDLTAVRPTFTGHVEAKSMAFTSLSEDEPGLTGYWSQVAFTETNSIAVEGEIGGPLLSPDAAITMRRHNTTYNNRVFFGHMTNDGAENRCTYTLGQGPILGQTNNYNLVLRKDRQLGGAPTQNLITITPVDNKVDILNLCGISGTGQLLQGTGGGASGPLNMIPTGGIGLNVGVDDNSSASMMWIFPTYYVAGDYVDPQEIKDLPDTDPVVIGPTYIEFELYDYRFNDGSLNRGENHYTSFSAMVNGHYTNPTPGVPNGGILQLWFGDLILTEFEIEGTGGAGTFRFNWNLTGSCIKINVDDVPNRVMFRFTHTMFSGGAEAVGNPPVKYHNERTVWDLGDIGGLDMSVRIVPPDTVSHYEIEDNYMQLTF